MVPGDEFEYGAKSKTARRTGLMNQQQQGIESEVDRYETDVLDANDEEDAGYQIDEYDLVASPNDFNITTIVDFIKSGVVKIPGFQRNFVWDIKRASKLIESIIIGLPIPQIFLYEQSRNKFLVIDGQQRLMSIYYFVSQRFPRKEKSAELRRVFDERGIIPDEILFSDKYFTSFNLNLPENLPKQPNKFNKLNYSTLGEDYQTAFNLRTIRNIIVKQLSPRGDTSMYEIFNRLNSGGTNLTPQEIRRCMFDSVFYEMLYRTNTEDQWRRLVGVANPDLHMKDVEILLRGFAMLIEGDKYNPSMVKFLNGFSEHAKGFDSIKLQYFQSLLQSFLTSCSDLASDAFLSVGRRFSPMIFEAVFVSACSKPYADQSMVEGKIDAVSLEELKVDAQFTRATQSRTTDSANVKLRLSRARELVVLK